MPLFAKTSTLDERSARLAGIGLMLFGVFMFSFGDALGKFLVGTYSVGQLLWLRACAELAAGRRVLPARAAVAAIAAGDAVHHRGRGLLPCHRLSAARRRDHLLHGL